MNKSNLLLTGRLEVTRQLLMGSHCGGRVPRHKASGVETPKTALA
ncbi:hypothetical protein [Nostoc sp.]